MEIHIIVCSDTEEAKQLSCEFYRSIMEIDQICPGQYNVDNYRRVFKGRNSGTQYRYRGVSYVVLTSDGEQYMFFNNKKIHPALSNSDCNAELMRSCVFTKYLREYTETVSRKE